MVLTVNYQLQESNGSLLCGNGITDDKEGLR